MTTKEMMEQMMATMNQRFDQIEANQKSFEKRLLTLEGDKKTTSTKKSSKSKSEPKVQKTREEALTEKYGDKEQRTLYVELRKKVAEEFTSLAKANEVYIPKKKYSEVLKKTTESLNGKFDKKAVKKMFLAAAK